MIELFASSFGFGILLTLFVVGAIGSLLLRKSDSWANFWSSFFAIAGSIWGLVLGTLLIVIGRDLSFTTGMAAWPLLSLTVHIDRLAAFFIVVISLITLICSVYGIGYIKHFYNQYSLGSLGLFYHLFIAGMILVVSAANGIFFLIVWEIMSIASYFLVVYDRHDENNVKAGFLYLVMTHVGTAFIIFSFLLLYQHTGSFDFANWQASSLLIPMSIKNVVFVLAMIGFGTKAGLIPFHVWLPSAHPAAPSHVSALMSGVMIKTGIYMMIRIFLDLLQPIPTWWGLAVLIIGSISALLGVLYALTEHDIKRLLAYHSIENIGIILLGLGSALTFASLNMPTLALLGLVAALFHTLNHATFKSLLFLSAGAVINQTHSRNMEEYGGLIKYMPLTAFCFLIGSMAISALPPFNGFFSEWLTFQALFSGIAGFNFYAKWIFMFAAGSLAFTGGLALACFVKAFGVTFLARPRSTEVTHAKEVSFSLRLGMILLAVLSLLFGIFSGYLTFWLEKIGTNIGAFYQIKSIVSVPSNQGIISVGNWSSVSAPAFFALLISALILVWFIVRFIINKNQKVTTGATWDCGTDLTPRMEITATGFARSITLIFQGILKPSIQHEVEYHDSMSRFLPKSRTIVLSIQDVYQTYLYRPLQTGITALSLRVKGIQSGNVNAYISYILITLMILLFFVL